MDLINLITGGLGGSVLGTVGALVTKGVELRQQTELLKLEMQKIDLEHRHSMERSDKQVQLEAIKLDNAALVESIKAEAAIEGVSTVVANIRALTRPVLTAVLVLNCMILSAWILYTHGMKMSVKDLGDLVNQLIIGLVVSTNLAISWWFGARSHTLINK